MMQTSISKSETAPQISTSVGAEAAHGGAICVSSLQIRNNASVLFEKNLEHDGDGYRLRSIETDASAALSAADGASIEIRDSISVGGDLSLNEQYVDAAGKVYVQHGDIVFTGKSTEEDLLDMKGSAGSETEILRSRTSEINGMTTLHGGRLLLQDGVVFQGKGVTLLADSEATISLENSTLYQAGYTVDIYAGNTLSVNGENILTAHTLEMSQGSILQMTVGSANMDGAAILTTTGQLSMADVSLNLQGTEYLAAGEYKLLTRTEGTDYDISGWSLTGASSDQLRWENGTLYYTGGHDWNHGVTDDDDISDLGEILGNLIINGGDVTLDDVVGAIQDAVDAGFGHGQGHIIINRGGIHISGAGDLDGHIIFNGDLKDIRKLFIEKDINNIKIELGGNSEAENIVSVDGDYTIEIDELSGDGSLNKTGEGEMIIHSKGNKVGGVLDVQEGKLTFIVDNESAEGGNGNETEVHELVVSNKDDKETKVKVNKGVKVKGDKLEVDGRNAVVTNEGNLEFTGEVKIKEGHLENQGSISKVTLEGGTISGSGTFAGLEMLGGELVVGNSPGLQTYTDVANFTNGTITFSLADAETAATHETHGWNAAAYSTIDMEGKALTLGKDINFVLEIGGSALEKLMAEVDASLSFALKLIQNIADESLSMGDAELAALLDNTTIVITADEEGLSADTISMAGRDITYMLSNADYHYVGNTLVFSGTVTNGRARSIPEPTTATLGLLAMLGLAMRRRRHI